MENLTNMMPKKEILQCLPKKYEETAKKAFSFMNNYLFEADNFLLIFVIGVAVCIGSFGLFLMKLPEFIKEQVILLDSSFTIVLPSILQMIFILVGGFLITYAFLLREINKQETWSQATTQKCIHIMGDDLSTAIIEYLRLHDKVFSYNSMFEALNNIAYSEKIKTSKNEFIKTKTTLDDQIVRKEN